jgi:hypothetical protein
MTDVVGGDKEAQRGAVAWAEKADQVMEGRKKMRQYINAGDLESPGGAMTRDLRTPLVPV